MKPKIAFFCGKDTPLKRYVSYFPMFVLETPSDGDIPKVILCHSIGSKHAVEFCLRNVINPVIIAMDGVETNSSMVINFAPAHKGKPGDLVYCVDDQKDYHHPYRIKRIRDKIVAKVLSISKIDI